MITAKTIKRTQIIQKWGRSLAVRIPASVARAAKLTAGQSIFVEVSRDCVLIRTSRSSTATLAQLLEVFDPDLHAGEVMAFSPRGAEAF